LTFVSISHTINDRFVPYLAKWLTPTRMHPRYFGTDPTDIRIRIDPKIRNWIEDYFWLKFRRWRRFALCERSCYYCYYLARVSSVNTDDVMHLWCLGRGLDVFIDYNVIFSVAVTVVRDNHKR